MGNFLRGIFAGFAMMGLQMTICTIVREGTGREGTQNTALAIGQVITALAFAVAAYFWK